MAHAVNEDTQQLQQEKQQLEQELADWDEQADKLLEQLRSCHALVLKELAGMQRKLKQVKHKMSVLRNRERNRLYAQEHRQQINEYHRKWAAEHPEHARE